MKKPKLNSLIRSDRFLMVFSVLLAIVIWLIVVSLVDPEDDYTIKDIPVTINLSGTSAESNGLSVVDTTQHAIDYTVHGKIYEIGKLTADNFSATCNVPDISEPGVYTLTISVSPRDTEIEYTEVSIAPSNKIDVEFDRLAQKTFTLEASVSNKEPADGYIIDKYTTTPQTLDVKGPESVMGTIDRVVVQNDESMVIKTSTAIDGELIFLDANGMRIDSSSLRYKDTDFKISIPLYKKTTLPLVFDYINVPEGIDTDAIHATISPADEINVAIPVDAATGVDKISLGQVDFRKIGLNKSFTFDVPLLAGYINLDEINQVTVSFDVTEENGYAQTYLNANNIVITNVPSGYDVAKITEQVSDILFVGKKDVIANLSSADVVLTADLSTVATLSEGEQRVAVAITVNDKKQAWAVGEKSILISVSKKQT